MKIQRSSQTPEDFPVGEELGWVPGAVTKYVATHDGHRFRAGLTDAERYVRYLGCCDLVDDLIAYCARKKEELPHLDDAAHYQRVRNGLERSLKVGISPAERQWVLATLTQAMEWQIGTS